MSETRDIGTEFYRNIGGLESTIEALAMMKEDIKSEFDFPENLEKRIEHLKKLFKERQYGSALEDAKSVKEELDRIYLEMAREKAKNPTMDDVGEHLAEIKLFMEKLRARKGNVKYVEKKYEEVLGEAKRRDPKVFFEKAGELRRELIYFDDMEKLKNYLKPLIDETGKLKKEGVHIRNVLTILKRARLRMKEYNIPEARRLSERVPFMLKGLKESYSEATEKLARVVDKIDLAEKRGINTISIGNRLVNAEKCYRAGKYNKANRILTVLHEELDTLMRDLIWLEEHLPRLEEGIGEIFSWGLPLYDFSSRYEKLRKEVRGGNISGAAAHVRYLEEAAAHMKERYGEITRLLPVARRRLAIASNENIDISAPKRYFKEAGSALEAGDFDFALERIRKSIKKLLIAGMES